ncbi:crotonobetaine/carnitine-CoA ligase [Marinobacter daqiaonensis]|uniref:Crotonobetaine/carnitine-CoA ligase n=1 Tax=Marinobacter daqiaonensis TaxID=650891 RepID=A0A1I6H0J5_9GAMM|nr:AMP-binding protein [Marinobacter daqiaonensis]SFR47974.1 crotonobetaine/carnitine-CoA ligase [Marinobacter daqiaonensis]
MKQPEEIFAQMVSEGDVALYQLKRHARENGDKVFIHYGETGERLTFRDVHERSLDIGRMLKSLGVTRGDPVSVLTSNSLLAAVAMFGCWQVGAVYAPINFNLRGKLLSYQINDTGAPLLITDPTFRETLEEIGPDIRPADVVVGPASIKGAGEGEIQLPNSRVHALDSVPGTDVKLDDPELGPFDPATIIYTSGTTGPAKGVLLPFRWINQYAFAGRSQWTSEDTIYCDLPMYHVGGAYALLVKAVWKGNTVGLWNRFSPSAFWSRIRECGASAGILLDVMIPWLMSAPASPEDRNNTLNKVHMQPLPSNHHEVAKRFGFNFVTCGFGQTESGAGFMAIIDEFGDDTGTPPELYKGLPREQLRASAEASGRLVVSGDQPLPPGFMGRPSPLVDVAILDEEDNRLPPGNVGQLAFRPRFPGLLLQQYLNKPEATLKAFRNLWFHTGDAVLEEPDGTFRFIDRMGGYFRVRGENVSSFEVESLLTDHPDVRSVAAVPVPAKEGHEDDIAVFVELREAGSCTENDIEAFAARQMPKYMRPRYIRIVDALPVTPTNKIEKYKLRQMLAEESD